MRYPPKSQAPEYLDAPDQDPVEFAGLLEAIRRTNRWYGGRTLILGYLRRFAAVIPHRPLTILDVATASADIPAAIAAWARKSGLPVRIAALDINLDILAAARETVRGLPEVALVRGNAIALPFPDRSIDVVICALSLHHFSFDDAAAVLREIDRVARSGFVVNDILRSWTAYAGILADTWLLSRNRLARRDGPLSVRRSFTWPEYHDLVRAAGLRGVWVRRHRLMRAVLVRWPQGLHEHETRMRPSGEARYGR
ncbi:MAG: methyltransferase domain-containing protein [Armatimonadetes bacterium]|nr:methyltransferase domain-containing protein [Armatimonadota bacterium]